MSRPRDYPFTVRLSASEKAMLEALASAWQIDKSAALRRLLRQAQPTPDRLSPTGQFITPHASFVIRLRKVPHESS